MEMTMRWFGKDYDTVTLEQIKQTRYATGIITTLYNKMPGEVWNLDEILAMKKEVEDAGLHLAGIESVNVSDAIKTGGAGRDHDIQAYIETLENLSLAGLDISRSQQRKQYFDLILHNYGVILNGVELSLIHI